MTAPRQWTVAIGVVMALVFGTALALKIRPQIDLLGVGSAAPGFHAIDLRTGRPTTLADYRGKVVLLNVWATWCEPCRVEMPSIEKLHKEFGTRGLAVVAVSVDDPNSEARVLDYAKELGLTFEVLYDPAQITKTNYQITGFPETVVIGRDGTIRKKVIGAADWNSDANRALMRELL